MIHLRDINLYDYVEHTMGTIRVDILEDDYGNDFEQFFEALNKNNHQIKLDIGLQSGELYDYSINEFAKYFRTPLNTIKLKLPSLYGIPHKLKLSPNIEKLTLYRLCDVDDIDFTENIKLKHIGIAGFSTANVNHSSIPTNIVKIHIIDKPKCFNLPPQIRILKVQCLEDMNGIVLTKDSKLEKINIIDGDIPPKKVINLSHIYNLKIIKTRTYGEQTDFAKKIKLPYTTVVEFY